MGKKLSVIVPVYKTENYLRKCVDSILASTYENLEVILVDDGSPDGSGAICDKYAERDARVKVIHKENGGLSSARNAGLDIATGDFITFVDSDDYIACDIYEKLVEKLMADNADIVMMNIATVSEDYSVVGEPRQYPAEWLGVKSSEWLFQKICERMIDTSVWSKIFRADTINSLRFKAGVLNEDFLFLSEMIAGKELKVRLVNDVGYYYYTRSGSITKAGFGKSLYDAVYNTNGAKLTVGVRYPELIPYIGAYAAYQARTAILVMTRAQYKEKCEFVEYCRRVIKENKKYIKGSFMNKKERLFCRMYIRLPRFTKWLFDTLRRGRR